MRRFIFREYFMVSRVRAFTLIELLVVVAIIAVLMAILLPSLGRAREQARSVVCMSNQRQLVMACAAYENDYNGSFPATVTTYGEQAMWSTALDPYLAALHPDDATRSGVAGQRSYKAYKQDPVWASFPTETASAAGTLQTIKEYARTIKMNTHLRRAGGGGFARIIDIERPSEHVMFGDGTSVDLVSWPGNTAESGAFSFDVTDRSQGGVGLRHLGSANIALVDGHVENFKFATYKRAVSGTGEKVDAWQSEYVDAAGSPAYVSNSSPKVDMSKPMEAQGLRRNGNMPLIWSVPGKLYRGAK
jgi:prepilin-type N-terminal cleavage/methylation domain-containing protein/prepilin-type processing-associated H-X9-DG protein